MMFVFGLVFGIFVGVPFGILLIALCQAAGDKKK